MKRIAIIGGGVAGLSAAIYASRNGFEAVVLEQHRIPGGLCTAWDRSGASGPFTLEGCIHYVLGLSGRGPFRQMWDELGVSRPVLPATELFTLRHADGTSLPVCADVDELARRMRALAPEDRRAIDRFVADVKLFALYEIRVDAPAEIARWDKLRSLGSRYPAFLAKFVRYRVATARTYARRFRNPALRWFVARLCGYPDYPAVWMLMVHSRMQRGEAGYPVGGSLELVRDLEERLTGLGGTIRYGSTVRGLRTRGHVVTGVLLDSGELLDADFVVAAADLRTTLEWMDDAGIPSRANEIMLAALRPGHAVAQVSVGVRTACGGGRLAGRLDSDAGESVVLRPRAVLAGAPVHRAVIRQYRRDRLSVPNQCRTITCQFETDYGWWARRSLDRAGYRDAKRRLAESAIELLERTWPGIASCVEVLDVATPMTTERYTSNSSGSVHGTRPDRIGFAWPAAYAGPRGSRLYFAGHWLCPGGGIHRAAQSGRFAVQKICARLGRAFEVPETSLEDSTILHPGRSADRVPAA